MRVVYGVLLPFLGTSLGALCVVFLRGSLNKAVQCALAGFAAGVMTAASVWSLLLPAIERSDALGQLAFLPAAIGFWVGVLLLMLLDRVTARLNNAQDCPKPTTCTKLMVIAVVLHNIPEGMAVGVAFAGYLSDCPGLTLAAAMTLTLGIAIQNIPEGAIISMPLHAEGKGKGRAFFDGVLSGVVEPIAAALTIAAAQLVTPILPYLLSFAAGAMIYVVVEELIPESAAGGQGKLGTVFFAAGFSVMMALDVALG